MFFESARSANRFVVQDIESLIVACENLLQTHFKEKFVQLTDNEDHNESITFDLAAEEVIGDISGKVYHYLINVRVIAAILANVFWNQIKILIRTRVQYDKELFNYEEYRKTGMMDNRLLKNTLFMASSKGCKVLVAEYFKFQRKHEAEVRDVEIELNTSGKITQN